MKKRFICWLLVLALICSISMLAVACKDDNTPNDDDPPVTDDELISTTMEKPSEGTPSTLSAKESLYIAAGELQRAGGFKGTTVGGSSSLGISQKVASTRTVVGNNVFKQSVSYSVFYQSGEQLYVYGNNFMSRSASKVKSLENVTWEDSAQKYTTDAWKEKIGYTPNGLTGYILNDSTILDGKLESSENGLFTFRYVLDTQKAPYLMLYEMRNNANSKQFAVFSKVEIVVTMDSNFIVQTLTTDCEYKASAAGLSNVPCKESITETFSDIGYNGDLPEKAFFEQYFNAEEVGEIGKHETTAVDVLTGMFNEYLTEGKTLNASVAVTSGTTKITNALLSIDLNMEDWLSSAAHVKIGDELYASYKDNKLLLDYQDFKGSTTVDGLKDFIATLSPETADAIDEALDDDNIFDDMTFVVKNGVCAVKLNITTDDKTITVNFRGTAQDDSYAFTDADITIDDLKLKVSVADSWEMPQQTGEYPEILGLSNLIDNGAITLKANLAETTAQVMLDIASGNVYVVSDVLNAIYADNTVYATFGDAKVKFDATTLDELSDTLSVFTKDSDFNIDLSLKDILEIVGNITATTTEKGVVLSAQSEDLKLTLDVTLVTTTDGWWLENISLVYGDISASLVPSEKFTAPQIENVEEYVDITDVAVRFVPALYAITSAQSCESAFEVTVDDETDSYTICGNLIVSCDNVSVNATVSKNQQDTFEVNVVYADGVVYVATDSFKYAFTVDTENPELPDNADSIIADIQSYLPEFEFDGAIGAVAEKIYDIATSYTNGELNLWDFISVIGNLSFDNNTLTLTVDGTLLGLDNFTVSAKAGLASLNVNVNDLSVGNYTANASASVLPSNKSVEVPNIEEYETDINNILETFIAQNKVELGANGTFDFDGSVWTFDVGVLYDNGNIFATATLAYDNTNALCAEVWYIDNVVYATVNGVSLAVNVADSAVYSDEEPTLEEILQPFYGYNNYLDSILSLVIDIATKAQNDEIDFTTLLKKVVISDDGIVVVVDGSQFGISDVTLAPQICDDGICIDISGFEYDGMSADIALSANITQQEVCAPDGDWTTNIAIDFNSNTIYASLDFINGLYNFLITNEQSEEDVYVLYDATANTIKVKKGDDIKVTCDIDEMTAIISYIESLVKDFNGSVASDDSADIIEILTELDIQALLAEISVEISCLENNLLFSVSAMDCTICATVSNDDDTRFENITLSVAEITLVARPCEKFEYADFSDDDYIALDQILNDYVETLETLVSTNCWQFTFDQDSQIDIVDENQTSQYQIAAGSYIKFYYNANNDQLMLRAFLDVNYLQNDSWTDLATLDAVLYDGRIYLTYNNTLKATISLEAIANCESLFNELTEVIPQLGELLNSANDMANEAENALENIDFTSILTSVSYDSETTVLEIVANGSALIAELGEISIAVHRTDSTITLDCLQLTYDNVTIILKGITVSTSPLVSEATDETDVETDIETEIIAEGETAETDPEEEVVEIADYEQYTVALEILDYFNVYGDQSSHMNFDSINQLLRAVIDTAACDTFAIDGTVTAKLKLLFLTADVPLDMSIRIDIDKNDNDTVYVAAKLTHTYTKVLLTEVFADRGGTGYLFYNGKTGEFTVIRDSYYYGKEIVTETYKYCTNCDKEASGTCKLFHSKYLEDRERTVEKETSELVLTQNDYYAKLTTEEFLETMMDQIFEMVHFSSTIDNAIRDAVSGEGGDSSDSLTTQDLLRQLQDIFLDYQYVEPTEEADGYFKIQANLKPINSSLQTLNLTIGHNYTYKEVVGDESDEIATVTEIDKLRLTYLKGDLSIASVVTLNFDFALQQEPMFGDAREYLTNETHW